MNKTDKIIFGSILCAFFPFLISLIGGSALIIALYFPTRIVLVKTLKADSE